MKAYTMYSLLCKCSKRMKIFGKLVKIFTLPAKRKCPNCKKVHKIKKLNPKLIVGVNDPK